MNPCMPTIDKQIVFWKIYIVFLNIWEFSNQLIFFYNLTWYWQNIVFWATLGSLIQKALKKKTNFSRMMLSHKTKVELMWPGSHFDITQLRLRTFSLLIVYQAEMLCWTADEQTQKSNISLFITCHWLCLTYWTQQKKYKKIIKRYIEDFYPNVMVDIQYIPTFIYTVKEINIVFKYFYIIMSCRTLIDVNKST